MTSNSTPGYLFEKKKKEEKQKEKKDKHSNVHNSIIYNCQYMEAICFDQQMNG